MWLQSWKQWHISFSFPLKCGAILLFFILCALVVACGNGNNSQIDPSNPAVTVTIDLNGSNGSPTPPLPDYLCGAWVTNTSPAFIPKTVVSVFAKFVHNVSGNPVGVDGATGTAQILWPDGTTDTVTAKTTADGLAVFPVLLKPTSLGKIVLVQVTFSKDGTPPCTVPQPAYFTPVLVSPQATKAPTQPPPPTGTATPTGTPIPFRTVTPPPHVPSPTPTRGH